MRGNACAFCGETGTRSTWPLGTVRPTGNYLQERTLDGWIAQHRLCATRRYGLWPDDVPCEDCGEVMATDVHHLDENERNNDPDNLLLVCEGCHNARHRPWEKRWGVAA